GIGRGGERGAAHAPDRGRPRARRRRVGIFSPFSPYQKGDSVALEIASAEFSFFWSEHVLFHLRNPGTDGSDALRFVRRVPPAVRSGAPAEHRFPPLSIRHRAGGDRELRALRVSRPGDLLLLPRLA